MSYTDEQVRTKFNILSDTQDSIEQVSQWVLFHRYVSSCESHTRTLADHATRAGDMPRAQSSSGRNISEKRSPQSS